MRTSLSALKAERGRLAALDLEADQRRAAAHLLLARSRPADGRRGRDRSAARFSDARASASAIVGRAVGLRRTRTASVSSPLSSTQALNGDIDGPVWRMKHVDVLHDELLRAEDDAAETAALAVDMLGRGIDHAVGAERQRALHRSASRTRCRRPASRRPRARSSAIAAMSSTSSVGLVGLSRKKVLVLRPHRVAPLRRDRSRRPASKRRRSAADSPRPHSGRSRTSPSPRRRDRRLSAGRPARRHRGHAGRGGARGFGAFEAAMRRSNMATVGLEKREY